MATAATAAVLLARRDRRRAPASPDLTQTAPIPRLQEEPETNSPPTAQSTDHPDIPPEDATAPSAAAAPHDGPSPSTAESTAALRPWLEIGVRGGQPVSIDLAAAQGLGLAGPGAPAVTRALLRRILELQPASAVLIAADTATELLGQPDDSTSDLEKLTADALLSRGTGREPRRVQVVPDPYAALQVTEAELVRRRSTSPPPQGWPLWLLLTAAPTTTPARHRLNAALAAGKHLGIAAILTSWSPTGWTFHIDNDHRVTHHSHASYSPTGFPSPEPAAQHPPTTPDQLVGAHLHTSTAAELRAALTRAANQPESDDPSSHPDTTPPEHLAPPPPATDTSYREISHDRDPSNPHRNHLTPLAVSHEAAPIPDQPRPHPTTATDHARSGHAQQPGTPRTGHHTTAPPDTSGPAQPPLWLSILGPTGLYYIPDPDAARAPATSGRPGATGRVLDRLGPRAIELLVFLAVHPNGVHRDTLVATLWPDADRNRPTNALNATLARLRAALRTTGNPRLARVITHVGDRFLLDPELIGVDYWTFLIATADITHPDPDRRRHACDVAIRTYHGHLAADMTSEWLITLREATRRRYFDALTTLARLTIHDEPERTLALLETARNLEPLTEGIYRDIMRIQAKLGRPDAAENTLTLLRTQLADIDTEPEPETLQLAATIRARATQPDTDANYQPPPTSRTDQQVRPLHDHP